MSIKSVDTINKVGETITDATSTIKGIANEVKDSIQFNPPQVLYGPAPSSEDIEELDLDEFDAHKIISENLLPNEQEKYGPPPTPIENVIQENLIHHEQMKYGPPPTPIENVIQENLINHEQMKYGPPPTPHIPSQILEHISQQEQYKYGPPPSDFKGDYKDKK